MLNYTAPVSSTAAFVATHAAQITRAARILGGPSAERRFALMVEDMADVTTPTRRLDRELDALEAVLSLHHIEDPYHPAAGLFAALDPADPVVADICALLDALRACRAADRRAAA